MESTRIMALDIGLKRIGIALSDRARLIASPHSVYVRRGDKADHIYFKKLITDQAVGAVIVGLPVTMDGSAHPLEETIRKYITKFSTYFPDLPVEWIDERLSSKMADRALRDLQMPRKQRIQHDDAIAATLLLQTKLG
jgi:putative Holliday junction resolvase